MNDLDSQHGTLALSFGSFRLFPSERRLERDGTDLPLGSRALDILIALADRAGEVVSRKDLIAYVWPDVTVDESSLRVQVAGLRKALGDGQNGARHVNNIPGRGYCFVAPVDRGYTRNTGASAKTATPATAHPLPPRLTRMVGRDHTIRAIEFELLAKRFVSIVGPGGIGKTTAAIATAHEVAAEFEELCFLDLASLSDPALLVATLAAAIGLPIHVRDPMPSLMEYLHPRRFLLVLDNCEHVIDAVATLTEKIFARAPNVHILTTTRETLRVEGEQVFHLPPLETPPRDARLTPDQLRTFPAIELFLERAMAGGYRAAITDAELNVVADICSRLDGIALAIELIAGRAGIHGIEGTAGLLDHRFRLLWQGRRTALARHQTLNALVDWSYNLLPEHERQVLRLLSIFVGGFSLGAARALVAKSGLREGSFEEIIEGLVNKSLLSVDRGERESVRYRLLGTTRAHALSKLNKNDEADFAAKLHAEYYANLFAANAQAQPLFRRFDPPGTFAGFLGNVRAALYWCFENGHAMELGGELAATSALHFLDLSLNSECYRWTKRAISALGTSGDGTGEMGLQEALALSAMFMTESSNEVRNALLCALQLAEALEDKRRQVRILAGLTLFLARIGECRESLFVAEQSKRIADQVADPDAIMVSDWMLGISHSLVGNPSCARVHLERGFSHGAAQDAGMNFIGYAQRIRARVHLARTYWLQGFPDQAIKMAQEALSEVADNGHPINMCLCLVHTTSVFLWCGDWDTAEEIIEKLNSHADRHALTPFRAVGLGFRGELLVRRGKPALGNALLRDGLNAMEAEKHKFMATGFAMALAEGLTATSHFDEALHTIESAIADAVRSGEEFELAEMLRVKAQILYASHGHATSEADDCLTCSLQRARRQAALGWELRSATTLAQRRRQDENFAEAFNILAPVYSRFTEGHGTRDLRIARTLISDLRRHSAHL